MNLGQRALFQRLALTVAAAAIGVTGQIGCFSDCDLKIKTEALPPATLGVDYRFKLDSSCGGDEWFLDDGTLPPGIQLQSDGDLRGAPTSLGTFNLTIGVFDFNSGDTAFRGFQIVVLLPAAPTPTATVGP